MCLTQITNKRPEPSGIGYKVMSVSADGSLRFSDKQTNYRVPTNIWIKACDFAPYKKPMKTAKDDDFYPLDFHIFKNYKDACKYAFLPGEIVCFVRYRKAHTEGSLAYINEVIVAEEIFIEYKGNNESI